MSINRVVHWVSYFPCAGKGSAVCSSLYCGTRYLIAVIARPTAQVPRWAGNVSRGPGSFPGRFWRTGVPSIRRCWHRRTGRGGEGGCSPPKFWATQIFWAARENLGKVSF